jgi:hypothetical protein
MTDMTADSPPDQTTSSAPHERVGKAHLKFMTWSLVACRGHYDLAFTFVVFMVFLVIVHYAECLLNWWSQIACALIRIRMSKFRGFKEVR